MVDTLIKEKLERRESLRPAISRLGNTLGDMIRDIVDAIISGECKDLDSVNDIPSVLFRMLALDHINR